MQLDFRASADPDTPITTVYDGGNGIRLRATCSGTSDTTPTMAITGDGLANDGIFQATIFNAAASDTVGPADGDLDNGDTTPLLTSGPGNELNGMLVNYAGADNTATSVSALARTKTSAFTPTQGNCSFVGTAIVAD